MDRLLLVAAQLIYIYIYILICTQVYSQLGCSKSSVHNLTVNLYSDSTCTTRVPYSSDTISVDLSDFSVRIRITSVLIFLPPLLDDCHQCTKNALLPCNSYFPFLYIPLSLRVRSLLKLVKAASIGLM
jgi:hypothetical protein